MNKTGGVLPLKGGTPVNNKTTPGGSSFNFNFEKILSNDVVKGMVIDTPADWDKKFFEGTPNSWSVAPKKDLTNLTEAVFTLRNITCNTDNPGDFEIMYYHIQNYPPPTTPRTKHLDVVKPPDPGKKTLNLDRGYIDVIHPIKHNLGDEVDKKKVPANTVDPVPVYITYNGQYPIENGFTYFLTNTADKPIVPSGGALDDETPVFYLSFLFGDDDNDLTSLAQSNAIQIDVKANKSTWGSMQHTQGSPYWKFLPKSPEILFGHETVYFPISQIVTILNTNPDTVTTMYVQWNNIKDYNDGTYTLELVKEKAVASIGKFTASPTDVNDGKDVQLTWTTSLAWRVTLAYKDRNGKEYLLDSKKGEIKLNATDFTVKPSKEYTTFTLRAYDDASNDEKQVTVHVNETAAEIKSFSASPPMVNVKESPAQTTFSWETTNASRLELVPYGPVTGLTSKTETINTTIRVTLEAYSYGTEHPQPAKNPITVYAYRTENPVPIGPKGDGTTSMQSLPLVLVNRQQNRIYVGNIGSNQVYDLDRISRIVKSPYPGNVMALSPDGSKLFVADGKGGTAPPIITMVNTATQATSSITLSEPPPYTMAVHPAMTYLFAAAPHQVDKVTMFTIHKDSNQLTYYKTLTVGTSPRAFAFNHDSSRLYVANYDSQSVSCIDLSNTSFPVTNIALQTPEPRALTYAYQRDTLNKLFVACAGENYVEVIDAADNTYETKIEVGCRPFAMALKPNKTKLYVANFGANTVSVIDTGTNEVIQPLDIGNAPSALEFSDDGTMLFVSSYCDKTISLVDTSGETDVVIMALPLEASGGYPLDLATYMDEGYYTDVFVAKEYFTPRTNCVTAITDPDLDISFFSVQGLAPTMKHKQKPSGSIIYKLMQWLISPWKKFIR
jgi:YVTN family beta-propeller protein